MNWSIVEPVSKFPFSSVRAVTTSAKLPASDGRKQLISEIAGDDGAGGTRTIVGPAQSRDVAGFWTTSILKHWNMVRTFCSACFHSLRGDLIRWNINGCCVQL